jgi:hypothetical protein
MRRAILCVAVLLLGCTADRAKQEVSLPKVPPDAVVVSWSVVSRSKDRDSFHAVLEGSRKLTVTNRAPSGTMMSVSRTLSKNDYGELVAALRELDCCGLESTTADRPDPAEAKPALEIDFGDMKCSVELWDREWREGKAKDCGLAFAQVHGGDFVPDPPVDDPAP